MAFLAVTVGAVAVMVILEFVPADVTVADTGLFVGMVDVLIFGLTGLISYETLRSSLVTFVNGMVVRQRLRGPRVILWSEAAGLLPPNTTDIYIAFLVGLNSGKRVGISRPKLELQKS